MNARRTARPVRKGARGLASLLVLSLFAAVGCGDEVGGDGWEPPDLDLTGRGGSNDGGAPAADEGGTGGSVSAGSGGKAGSAGKGGAGGKSGSSGKGGSGGRPPLGEGGSDAAGGATSGSGGTGGSGGSGATGGAPVVIAVCGNGTIEAPDEDCDDGNTDGWDDCPANCRKACTVCEQTYCKNVRNGEAGVHGYVDGLLSNPPRDLYTNCEQMPGLAAGGPAQGVERAELCTALVDCVLREKCEQYVPPDLVFGIPALPLYSYLPCYCNLDITLPDYLLKCQDPSSFVAGKCQREFQEASEKDTPSPGVFAGLANASSTALGAANGLLLACDTKLCLEECRPSASVGTVTEISEDILWARAATGQSPLGSLVVDAYRASTGTTFAILTFNDLAFTAVGKFGKAGLRLEAAPGRGADAAGRVLESELLQSLYGMDYRSGTFFTGMGAKLVTLKLTGQQIYTLLSNNIEAVDVSGLTFVWDNALMPLSTRVTEVKKDGVLLDMATSYSITVNDDFSPSVTGATDVVMTDKEPFAELKKYLSALQRPVAAPAMDRVTRLN